MKKQLLVAAMIMISAISLGQKKEIKKAEKAIKSGDFTEALTLLNTAEGMLGSADEDMKTTFYSLKGQALGGLANGDLNKMKAASEAISKAIKLGGKGAKEAEQAAQSLRVQMINSAVQDQNANNYDVASEKLYASYLMTKKDTADLYYAAGAALNAKNYDKAASYYQKLVDLGFTDKKKQFVATEKSTGEEKVFGTKSERDLFVRSGEYIKPETKISQSKRGEVLRNLSYIYIDQNNNDKALVMIQNAKKENPNDIELLKIESSLAFEMGDMEKYDALMKDIIKSDPNNPELYFNLGVAAANNERPVESEKYYKRAIEIDPNYTNALINLGVLKLSKEKAIIDEMNSLGTSRADNARYDALKEERKQMYLEAIPFFEKALTSSEGENYDLVKSLADIYMQVGNDAKYKEMKAKMDAMKN